MNGKQDTVSCWEIIFQVGGTESISCYDTDELGRQWQGQEALVFLRKKKQREELRMTPGRQQGGQEGQGGTQAPGPGLGFVPSCHPTTGLWGGDRLWSGFQFYKIALTSRWRMYYPHTYKTGGRITNQKKSCFSNVGEKWWLFGLLLCLVWNWDGWSVWDRFLNYRVDDSILDWMRGMEDVLCVLG